ncbi:MAG TPA: hypothetical protein VH797_06075 [Nitrososphaeraceae archaeon]|jgi:hypothetical protein
MEASLIILIIHILAGLFLVYITARAYKRTKYIPMLLLTFGFFLIVFGDTILGDLFNSNDQSVVETLEELVETSGFIMVIIAVIKS